MKKFAACIAQHLKDDLHLIKLAFFPLNSKRNPLQQYEAIQQQRFAEAYNEYKLKYDEALKRYYDDSKRAEVMKDREWLFKLHAMLALGKVPDCKKTQLEQQFERCQSPSIFMLFVAEFAVAYTALAFALLKYAF